jgi:hypothetical protein
MEQILRQLEVVFPKYLTPDQSKELWRSLGGFPNDMLYYLGRTVFSGEFLQGDLCAGLPVTRIRDGRAELLHRRGVILSNSCDISPDNNRHYVPNVLFAPLIGLENWADYLRKSGIDHRRIDTHLDTLRKQNLTSFIYFPAIDGIEESFVRLDDIHRLTVSEFQRLAESGDATKVRTLSQAAFYILTIKLSIHFCRHMENIPRFDDLFGENSAGS